LLESYSKFFQVTLQTAGRFIELLLKTKDDPDNTIRAGGVIGLMVLPKNAMPAIRAQAFVIR